MSKAKRFILRRVLRWVYPWRFIVLLAGAMFFVALDFLIISQALHLDRTGPSLPGDDVSTAQADRRKTARPVPPPSEIAHPASGRNAVSGAHPKENS